MRPMVACAAGAFVEFDLSRIANDSSTTLLPFDHERSGSIGGRVGFLATPTTLWDALGGYTQSSVEFLPIGSKDLKGGFVGGCTWLEAETSSHTGRLLVIYRFGSGGWTP